MNVNDTLIKTDNGLYLPKDYTIYIKIPEREITERKLNDLKKIAEIKQWGIRNPTKFLKEFVGVELLDLQEYIFMNSWSRPFVLWLESRNAGKALALDTPIPTPTGYKTMRDIQVNDYVYAIDGTPTKVVSVSPIFYNHDCYEIEFSDGEKIIADADHLWSVQTRSVRHKLNYTPKSNRKRYNYDKVDNYGFITLKTSDLVKDYKRTITKYGKQYVEYKYRIPIAKPLSSPKIELPIHPYILGLWLGDGEERTTEITCSDFDLEDTCNNIKQIGCSYKVYQAESCKIRNISKINVGYVGKGKGHKNPINEALKKLNLIQNKHIPDIYLNGSIEQRLALLQGLMDTDGTCDPQGRCSFSQKSYDFCLQVSKLLNSLSIYNSISPKISTCNGKKFKSYVVYFKTDKTLPCFRMKRKFLRLKDTLNPRSQLKTIISIKQVDSVPTKCIRVEHERHLYLCGKHNTVTHNSMMLAVFIMTKGLLFNNYRTFICSGTASQSQETFKKIEDIAMQRIESMANLSGFFRSEVNINNQNSNGFIHNPACFTYQLYNGSFVKTLTSAVDSGRGYRAECVAFDEGGWLTEEQFNVYAAFTAQNSNFKLGGNIDVRTLPKEFPHQLLYASSASSVDTAFYKKFKDFSQKMILGDPRYFVADITCDTVMTATFHGVEYPTPLLTRDTVDGEMRINPEKAAREYFNKFTRDGGVGQIIKRVLIAKNSFNRVPVLFNDTSKRKFVFAFDPARTLDNSVLGIGELVYDDTKGWMLNIVNCINFADVSLKKKTPLTTQQQIKLIKKALIDYNGEQALDWENIECFMIDAGAGGGGNRMPDFFFEDWKDENNIEHRGLIDTDYSEEYVERFPHAVQNVLKLIEPSKYKSDMFEALIKMVEADLITFPERYDNKGYINLMHIDKEKLQKAEIKIREKLDKQKLTEEEYNCRLSEELVNIDSATTEVYKLSLDEEIALIQINAMVEEIVNICRVKRESGKDGFKLPTYKDADCNHSEGTLHDDRAYVLAMLGWYLSEKRREGIVNKPVQSDKSWTDRLIEASKTSQRFSYFGR